MFDDLENGTVVGGKYRIEGVLGTGGMGAVYQATNSAIGRRVAIKLLDAKLAKQTDFLHRFQMEAKASAMIGHPNIVDVLDMGEMDDGSPFIVMEYLEGVTLKSLQKKLGSLSPGEVVAVAGPVLDALAAAHAAGVIHRDLKPANIFISLKPVPAVKILDFGISKFSNGSSAGITQTGMSMGTPAYMAPEQVRGEKQIGPEADLYSIGAILYNLLSGHPPFEGESDLAVVARVLTDQHRSLSQERPDLPPKLTQLVDRLLTKAKESRPRDASLVKRALETVAAPDMDAVIRGAKTAYRSISLTGLRPPEPDAPTTPTTPTGGRQAKADRTKASRPAIGKATPMPVEESAIEPPQASKAPIIAVAAAALVLIGGAGTWFFLSRNDVQPQKPVKTVEEIPIERPKPDKLPDQPKPVEKVTLKVTGEPKGARFTLNGKPLGECNPCELPGDPGSKGQLEASADGYVSRSIELTFDQSREVPVTLTLDPKKTAAVQNVGRKTPQPTDPKDKKKGGMALDESNPYAK